MLVLNWFLDDGRGLDAHQLAKAVSNGAKFFYTKIPVGVAQYCIDLKLI